ncbi:hypothetical protein GGF37_002779, partial [Kickxella alabastrina]
MAVINATAMSRGFLQLLMTDDGIKVQWVELALANGISSSPTQSYAAKGLVALMYAGQVEARDVVCNVLALLLRQMECMYLNTLELAFYPVGDSDKALGEIVPKRTRLGQQMNAALVLFSAMQVVAAQQGMWMDAGVLVVFDVLGYFQMGLLGQLAAYIQYSCEVDTDLMKSLGIWSSAVNMGVDAVVASYYVVVGEEDNAHCHACRRPVKLSQEHKIHMEDISSEHLCFSAMLMGVLADSLLVAGLGMQSPETMQCLLYLMCILGCKLALVLHGMYLHALAAINVCTLCRRDAQQQLLEGSGVCFDDCGVSAAKYFDKFLEVELLTVAQFSEFYAQPTIDRCAAGWQTGTDMFASAGNDQGVNGFGNVGLVVNHSGLRGTAIDCKVTEVPKPVPAADILFSHLRIKPSSAAAAIADNVAALADEPHLLYLPYWNFESVVATTYIWENASGKHSFHVRLFTGQLMQVGWCLDQCRFFLEGGESVRYDLQSISYDGMQICK